MTSPAADRLPPDEAGLVAAVVQAPDPSAAREALTAALLHPDPIPLLRALEAAGVLTRWLPELAALRGVSQLPDHLMDVLDHSFQACAAAPATVLSRWTALLHDCGKASTGVYTPEGRRRFTGHEYTGAALVEELLPRLGWDAAFTAAVAGLIRLHLRPLAYRPTWTDGAVMRLRAEAGALWPALLAQCRADLLGYAPEPLDAALENLQTLATHAEHLAHPPPPPPGSPLDGHELQALFARPPGPWLRVVKIALEQEVRAGRLPPTDKAGAAARARAVIETLDREGETPG